MMEKLRAGIIGTGRATGISIAHYHGYQHSGKARVTAVYNEPLSLANQWCEENRIEDVKICKTMKEFLDCVDVVSICTPNFTHMDYVERCMDAGKHILCEKPVGSGQQNLKNLEEKCTKYPLINMINFNYRQIPGLKYLAGWVREGKLGDVIIYRHTMGGGRLSNESLGYEWRMDRAKSGCGSLGDFGCHILDTMLFVLGQNPNDIKEHQAMEKIQIKHRLAEGQMKAVENDDCSVVQGSMEKGTLFSFMTSRVGALGNCLELIGTKGIARFSMDRPYEIRAEFREAGSGYQGLEKCWKTEDIAFSALLEKNPKAEMAACSRNTEEFVNLVVSGKRMSTPISYGLQIEQIIHEIDADAIKR